MRSIFRFAKSALVVTFVLLLSINTANACRLFSWLFVHHRADCVTVPADIVCPPQPCCPVVSAPVYSAAPVVTGEVIYDSAPIVSDGYSVSDAPIEYGSEIVDHGHVIEAAPVEVMPAENIMAPTPAGDSVVVEPVDDAGGEDLGTAPTPADADAAGGEAAGDNAASGDAFGSTDPMPVDQPGETDPATTDDFGTAPAGDDFGAPTGDDAAASDDGFGAAPDGDDGFGTSAGDDAAAGNDGFGADTGDDGFGAADTGDDGFGADTGDDGFGAAADEPAPAGDAADGDDSAFGGFDEAPAGDDGFGAAADDAPTGDDAGFGGFDDAGDDDGGFLDDATDESGFGEEPAAGGDEDMNFFDSRIDRSRTQPAAKTVKFAKSAPAPVLSEDNRKRGMRVWTDNTGHYQTVGRLVVIAKSHVRLLKDNGRHTTVQLNRLSSTDLDYVLAVAKKLVGNERIALR